jgi:hypothetical protein
MSIVMKYNLQQFNTIAFNGFQYSIPQSSIDIINDLTSQVGSSAHVKSNLFQKKGVKEDKNGFNGDVSTENKPTNKKRKGNRAMEMSNEEWNTLRAFQATKIEHKTGIDSDIDQIRLHLNKLSDKTFTEMKEKIVSIIDILDSNEDFNDCAADKINNVVYDISSSNKFYSKIYADLYSVLINKYIWMKQFFDNKIKNYIDNFNDIEFFDPDKNYDKFCEMNKKNEIRKAHSQFIVNLSLCGVISRVVIMNYLKILIEMVMKMINESDKKNEVDEFTENIAILYNKDILDDSASDDNDEDEFLINVQTIIQTITMLAKCKAKDYKSLSNKAIFKYMDLIEI